MTAMRTSLHGRRLGLGPNDELVSNEVTILQPRVHSISVAAGAANVCNVTVLVKNQNGVLVAGVRQIEFFLSDAATGAGLTATAASGTVAPVTGTLLTALTAKKHLICQTDATGTLVVAITDTAKTGFYPCVNGSFDGTIAGAQLVTGNYG